MKKIFYLPLLLLCFLFQASPEAMGQCTSTIVSGTKVPVNGAIQFCEGEALTFSVSTVPASVTNYRWNFAGGIYTSATPIFNVTSAVPSVTTPPGLYSLTLTMTHPSVSCSGNTSTVLNVTVNIEANPTGIFFTSSSTPLIGANSNLLDMCPGTSTVVTANCLTGSCPIDASGYTWTAPAVLNGRTSVTVTAPAPNSTVVYSVMLKNTVGCTTTENVTVTGKSSPNITLTAYDDSGTTPTVVSAGATICSETDLFIVANCSGVGCTGLSYVWSGAGAGIGDSYGLQGNGFVNNNTITALPATIANGGANITYRVTVTNAFNCVATGSTASLRIRPYWQGNVTINPIADICEKDTFTLSTSCVSGCGGNVRYRWADISRVGRPSIITTTPNPFTTTTPSTTSSFIPVLPTSAATSTPPSIHLPDTFKLGVFITNQWGCVVQYSSSGNQYVNPLPVVDLSNLGLSAVCANTPFPLESRVTLSTTSSISASSPSYLFSWLPLGNITASSPTINTNTILGTATATIGAATTITSTFSYRPTTGLVCSDSDTTQIIISASALGITATNPTICRGGSTGISVSTVTGGSYLWSSGQTTSTIMVAPQITTTYTVTVTDNSCAFVTSTTISVNTPASVNITNPGKVCNNDIVQITGSASGGLLPYQYQWTIAGTPQAFVTTTTGAINYPPTVTASSTTPTAYALVVTDANTCTTNTSFNLTATSCAVRIEKSVAKEVYCEGDTVILTAIQANNTFPNPAYSWSTGEKTPTITLYPPQTSKDITVGISNSSISASISGATNTITQGGKNKTQTVVFQGGNVFVTITDNIATPSTTTTTASQINLSPGQPSSNSHIAISVTFVSGVSATIAGAYINGVQARIVSGATMASSGNIVIEVPCMNVVNGEVVLVTTLGAQIISPKFLNILGTTGVPYNISSLNPTSLDPYNTTQMIISGANYRPVLTYEIKRTANPETRRLAPGTYNLSIAIPATDQSCDIEINPSGGAATITIATSSATTTSATITITEAAFPIKVKRISSAACGTGGPRAAFSTASGNDCSSCIFGFSATIASVTNAVIEVSREYEITVTAPLANITTALTNSKITVVDLVPVSSMVVTTTQTSTGCGGNPCFDWNSQIYTTPPAPATVTFATPATTNTTITNTFNGLSATAPLSFATSPSTVTAEGPSYITHMSISDYANAGGTFVVTPVPNVTSTVSQASITIGSPVVPPTVTPSTGSVCLYEYGTGSNSSIRKVVISSAKIDNPVSGGGAGFLSATFSLSVSQLSVDLTSTRDTLCAKDTIKLKAETDTIINYAYKWGADPSNNRDSIFQAPLVSTNYAVTVTDNYGCTATDTRRIVVNKLPGTRINPSVAGSVKFCPNSSATLLAFADSITCTANCTYEWQIQSGSSWATVGTNNSLNRNREEVVKLGITASNCTDFATVTITKYPVPFITITNGTSSTLGTLCYGQQTTLSIVSPAINSYYQWNVGPTQNTLTVTSPGGYYAQVTDANGCIGFSNPILVTNSSIGYNSTITANPTQICNGGTATLAVNSSLGSKYIWYQDLSSSIASLATTTTPSYAVTATGDYFVDVINRDGCVFRSVNNTNITNTVIAPPIITSNTDTICVGDTVRLSTPLITGASYQWYRNSNVISAATSNQYATTENDTFYVVVTYSNGCIGTSPKKVIKNGIITPNLYSQSTTNAICNGSYITLYTDLVPGYTYQWYRNGIVIAGANTSAYDATTSGSYYVRVTNNNGCVANTATRILTVSSVTTPVATANKLSFCPNEQVRLSVSLCAGCSYLWFRNGIAMDSAFATTSYIKNVSQPGIYSARVKNLGCEQASNSITVSLKPVPVPPISTSVNEVCNGVSPVLRTSSCVGCVYTWLNVSTPVTTATPPSYTQIFGAPNDTLFTVTNVGRYAVKVNYPNGCSDTSTQQIIITGSYNVTLDTTAKDTICNGSNKTLTMILSDPTKCSGGCNYEWFKDGSLAGSGPFNTFTTNTAGKFQVKVTTPNGCVATSNLDTVVAVTLSPQITGSATQLCGTSPVTLRVDTCVGCTYAWGTGQTTSAIVVTVTAPYVATVTQGAYCSATTPPYVLNSITGLNPAIAANPAFDTSICAGDSVTLRMVTGCSACTFQWLRGATSTTNIAQIPAATQSTYSTNLDGYYALITRDTSNNCVDTSNFQRLTAVNAAPGFRLNLDTLSINVLAASGIPIDLDMPASNVALTNFVGLLPTSLRTTPPGRYYSTPLFAYNPPTVDPGLVGAGRRDMFDPQTALPGNYQITYEYQQSGCTFTTSSIVRILDAATITVTNNYINAPSYEACVGDTLLIRTDNFPFAINSVFVLDQNDNYVSVSLFSHTATVASFGGTNIYRDSIHFVVPDWAKACFVRVSDGITNKFTQFVQIHNAPLSLSGLPNTVCSNGAPIALTGTPSGGTFIFQSSPSFPSTTTIPGVFTGNILDPTAIPIFPVSAYDSAGIIDSARVIYQYISHYTNSAACRIPDTVTQKVVARAVTLNSVRYNKISASQTTEKLDNLVAQVIPYTATPSRWLVPGMVARGHAIRYSGSFTSPAGNPINYLPQNAGVGPSNLNYTIINGVCENTVSNDITVLPLPSLVPIADTICRNAAPVVFGRDPLLPYSTAFLNVGAGVTYRDTIYAIRVRTETVSATSNAYLTTLNPNPNLESYRYQPLLTPHTNHDTIRIDYVFKRVEYNGTVSYNSVTYTVASSVQPIYIEDTIATFIVDSLLSRVYCEGNTDYLAVGVPSGGVFSLQGGTGAYNTNSLLVNNIINPTAIHQNESSNTSYTLTYNVQGAACQSQDTFRFLIPEPLDPSFHTLSGFTEYCNSALPDSIVRHTPNYGAVYSTILVNGVAQPGIKFTPTFQTPGQQIITHQLTDTLYGCVTSATDTFQVYALPNVSISNITTTEYCTNDSSFQFTISPSPVCAGATGGEIIREGFDLPQLPNGWQFANLTPASSGWSQGFVGGYGVALVDTTSVPQNTWMYTRPVAMVAGGTYQIEYWLRVSARQCMTCSDASMKVTVGQGQNPGAQTAILADFPTLDDNYAGFFTRQSHSFIAPAAGNFNFAFHAYSSGNTVRRITLDTVIVRQISAANCQNGIGAITGAGIASIPGQDSVFRFVPTSVPAGQHTIRYIFSDTRSCIDSVVIPITMKPHPTVSIASLNPTYCDNAPAVPLSGAPVGGTFSVTRWTGTGNSNVYIGSSVLPYAGTTTTGSTTYNTSVQLNFLPRVVGTQLHTYRYRDPITQCATSAFDTVTVVDIPDSVRISTLDTAYCEYAAPVTLSTASIRGGAVTGHFYGAGVVNGALGAGVATLDFPAAVAAQGRNGDDLITYAYVASNGCLDTTRFTTRINDRPRLSFDLVPANFRLPDSVCQNAPGRPIRVNWQQWDGALGNILIDSIIPFGAGQLFSPIISPVGDSLNPNTTMLGWYPVRYSFTNVYGCLDTIRDSVRVDTFPDIYFAGLPTSRYYCENEAGGLLLANPPYYPGSGYLAIKNYPNIGDSTSIDSSFFFINPAALATPAVNRTYPLFYTFRDLRGCTNTGRDTFTVRPYPRISFSMPAVFCNAADTVSLNQYVSATGGFGIFSDNLPYTAIVRDSLLNLNITGPRVLTYFYQNTVTQCSNTSSVPITVYHTPSVDFVANGGCTGVSVEFVPSLSNLDIAFDSITQVIWTYSPGNSATITPPTPTTLANNYYSYGTDGYFNPVLSVINRGICAATVTHPLIVSPTVVLNRWGAPYVEDFQTTASRPSWYPEQVNAINLTPAGGQYDYPDTTWSAEPLNRLGNRIYDANNLSNKAWVTYAKPIYALHSYRAGSRANVYSPCFDFTNTWRPMISMDVWKDMQEGIDGAVLEYYHDTSRTWRVLGALNQGIGWYNSDFLLSRPGAQLNSSTLTPTGWTGESNGWENARFRLDQFAGRPSVRFRVSFAAAQNSINPNLPTNQQLQGFAFDSVWIGERSRNVLVEHFTNYNYPNVNTIDQGLYNKIFTNINGRDVNLIQYNTGYSSPSDQLFIFDSVDVQVRRFYYGIDDDNRAIVDGTRRGDGTSENLDLNELDYDMLQFPAFDIFLNPLTVQQTATGYDVTVGGSILANKVMPQRDYRLRTVIVEDSILSQPDPSGSIPSYHTMAVMRRYLPNAAGVAYNNGFWLGQSIGVPNQTYSIPVPTGTTVNPARLSAVVFIQDEVDKDVYQVATTRDLTIYAYDNLTGVSPIEPTTTAETASCRLYPNPTVDNFTVDFEKPLISEHRWKVIDILGQVVEQGQAQAGTQQIQVNTQKLAPASYFFVIENGRTYTQRQVIIYKP